MSLILGNKFIERIKLVKFYKMLWITRNDKAISVDPKEEDSINKRKWRINEEKTNVFETTKQMKMKKILEK